MMTNKTMSKKRKNTNTLEADGVMMEPEPRSRFITITVGGKSARVHYKKLWGMFFVLGDENYRAQMIPVQKEERMIFSRKHRIVAKRDMNAGEELVAWCEVDVRKTVVEAIAEENGAKVIRESPPIPLSTGIPLVENTSEKL